MHAGRARNPLLPGADTAGQRRPAQRLTGQRHAQPVRPGPVTFLLVEGDLGGELGAGGDVEPGEHVGQVGLHGPPRDVQPGADLRVGSATGHHP